MKTKDGTLALVVIGLALVVLGQQGRPPGFLRGDVNGDGVVNVGDVIVLGRIIAGVDPTNPRADVNGDGVVNQADIDEVGRIILRSG